MPDQHPRPNLQRRLLRRILPALVAASLAVSAASGALTWVGVRSAILKRQAVAIAHFAPSLAEPLWSLRYEALEQMLNTAVLDNDVVHLAVTDDAGLQVASVGDGGAAGKDLLTLRRPILLVREHMSEQVGTLEVRASLDRARAEAQVALLVGLATTLAATLALFAGVTVAHRSLVLRPLGRMVTAMQQAGAGGPRERIALDDAAAEFAHIAATYNAMQDRLEADARERAELTARLDAALTHMAQGIELYSPSGELLLVNGRAAELLGVLPGTFRPGMTAREVLQAAADQGVMPPDKVEPVCTRILDLAARRASLRELVQLASGRSLSICHEPLPDGGWVTTYEDVTERRRSDERAAFLARHDPLTGLANRAAFGERLDTAVAGLGRGIGFAVLCLDLDRFKAVNDTLGHAAGDALLKQVTDRLLACVRETDTVARLGGDEFAILQSATSDPDAPAILARRVIEVVSAPYDLDGHQVSVGTSVGIARAPQDGALATALLKNADLALYRAKADGRGVFRHFEVDMDARLQERRRLEADLRRALPDGAFELHYQPLVSAATGRVVSFEALLRWRHPERGMVPPEEFIPLAEETGLIQEIGNWVLRQACADAAQWPGDVGVAVNLSPVQFRRTGLLEAVRQSLAASGLEARRLELEITETVLLKDTAATLSTLTALRALGARIAMDDFGTGYSSLSYLRQFPFDKIKIDRSFVHEVNTQAEAAAIVRAVAALARSLGVRTTAEGVETPEQLAHLLREGCTEAQGYLFSRPRPARDVPGLIARLNAEAALARPRAGAA